MRNSHSFTWFGQMLLSLVLFFGGLAVMNFAWNSTWELTAAGGVASVLGFIVMALAEKRDRPRRILRNARRTLTFPTQWAVKFNKSLPQGGVIPVAVIRSDGVRFLIDIHSFNDAAWSGPMMPGRGLLVGPGGKPFKNDPVEPLMQAAAAWSATPILWLPQAKQVLNLRQPDGPLVVVLGGARELNHVLRSAEIAVRRQAPSGHELTMPPKKAAHTPVRTMKKAGTGSSLGSPEPA